jgi:lipoprotein-anchoring transpeptidase ErfK/SrfK
MMDLLDAAADQALPPEPAQVPRTGRRFWVFRVLGVFILWIPLLLVLLGGFFFLSTGYGYRDLTPSYLHSHTLTDPMILSDADGNPMPPPSAKALAKTVPTRGAYIVIDRVHNRLRLYEDGRQILDAVVSAGAGSILEDPSGKRKWVFDTPTGRFFVKSKRESPTWTAPDWEYIESGEPMPRNYADRVQEGMLGEYALDLGGGPSGYMIHGTLYTRLLGRNVSHGCIRVGRDDLRIIWKKAPVGTPVFMY